MSKKSILQCGKYKNLDVIFNNSIYSRQSKLGFNWNTLGNNLKYV